MHPQPRLAPSPTSPGWLAGLFIGVQRAGLAGLGSLARRFGRDRLQPAHLLLGERGEIEALFFLKRQGYIVVARRWRSAELNGDLDLVAWDGDTLCFIEVKSRAQRDQTPAALAIGQEKRRMLSRMAQAYLQTLPRPHSLAEAQPVPARFDFLSVYLLAEGTVCELLRDAFDSQKDRPSRYGV